MRGSQLLKQLLQNQSPISLAHGPSVRDKIFQKYSKSSLRVTAAKLWTKFRARAAISLLVTPHECNEITRSDFGR